VRSLTSKVVPYPLERAPLTLELPVGNDCARLLVEALIAGPDATEKAAGAIGPFPRESDVNGVVLRDGVLTVDFNERLRNVGGACAATAIRHSVTRTLSRLPAVKRVVITAAGSEKLALQP
jgi:spore germination protein GerM